MIKEFIMFLERKLNQLRENLSSSENEKLTLNCFGLFSSRKLCALKLSGNKERRTMEAIDITGLCESYKCLQGLTETLIRFAQTGNIYCFHRSAFFTTGEL